ncbi:SIR2 family protein [Carnobacterium maltaromaticum]|uniref:SIR2 family protein n=1 Tax=Carnobacterium maltaromaticum TaxID=2751 RepID=UPI00295F427D|nr:SIR2 family protein [Carnobacterium maltaromaticum]
MELEQAIKYAMNGNAILFTGAGFSAGVSNMTTSTIPFASQLSSEILSKELQIPPNNDLGLTSDMYIKKIGEDKLIDLLKELFITTGLTKEDPQAIISSLPWSRIYTTNYDDAIEKGSHCNSIPRTAITLGKKAENYANKDVIIHLNGYISDLDKNTLKSEFKLAKSSYIAETFKNATGKWYDIFKSDIEAAQVIIFVGVSFDYDIDIQQIIFNSENFNKKIIFIDKILTEKEKENSETINFYKNNFGTVYNIGVKEFGKQIIEVSKNYKAIKEVIEYTCFEEVTKRKYKKETSEDLRNLLKMGFIDHDIAYYSRLDDSYLITRVEENKIYEDLNNGLKCACVISGIANGKTTTIVKLGNRLSEIGEVFIYSQSNKNLAKEIKSFQNKKGKVFIIIENYYQKSDLLRKMRSLISYPNIHFIVSARTFIHDTQKSSFVEKLRIEEADINEYYLDEIQETDLGKVSDLLENSDYFLKLSKKNRGAQKRYIKNKWNSQFNDILLELIESPTVKNEIKSLYNGIRSNEVMENLVLLSCIFKVFDLPLRLNEGQMILNTGTLPLSFYHNEDLNNFIKPGNNLIVMQSTTLAKHIILEFGQSKLLELLNIINENVDQLSDESKINSIKEAIVSFSNLSLLINKRVRKINYSAVVEFYYKIRNKSFYKNNEFFWLQYTMAAMENKDYERAYTSLMVSYDLAGNKDYKFDTFQMDTQYARFLLETDVEDELDYFKRFKKAHELLKKAMASRKGQGHLIFKQVIKYDSYYDKHRYEFTSTQKNIIRQNCEYFIEAMKKYNDQPTRIVKNVKYTESNIKRLEKLKDKILKSYNES